MEVELKILEIDVNDVVSKLERKGAEKILDERIKSVFLKNLDGEKLRLRKYSDKNILTFKKVVDRKKAIQSDEYEVEVGDFAGCINFLEALGFVRYGYSKKYRVTYKLEEVLFEMDSIELDDINKKIPTYLEIESDQISKVEQAVLDLGFTLEDTVAMTERQVKEYYGVFDDVTG